MEPESKKERQSNQSLSDETLPATPVFESIIEELLDHYLEPEEVELLKKFNNLSTAELLSELKARQNLNFRELADLLGSSKSTMERMCNGKTETPESLVKSVRNFLLENWREKDPNIGTSSSRVETKLSPKKHEGIESSNDSTLPPVEGQLRIPIEQISERELSLMRTFNELGTADILHQLKELGISNKEVVRRTGIDASHLSRVVNGKAELSVDRSKEVRKILLDEKLRNLKNQEVEPSQDKTKAEKVDTKTEITGSLPRAAIAFEGELNLFTEPLSRRELSLLQAFSQLDTASILEQLGERGISNKEIERRTGISHSHIAKVKRREADFSGERHTLIRSIAIQERTRDASTTHGQSEAEMEPGG